MLKKFVALSALSFAVASADAQNVRTVAPLRAFRTNGEDSNAPRIGVYLGEGSAKDTAGVLVNSVIKDSPADKAGLKDGDRIVAVNGVNLKMTRDDADDPALGGMMTRRLTRELDKLKAGDEVELRVASGSTTKSVRVKTVAARDLESTTARTNTNNMSRAFSWNGNEDRAALGLSLGGTTSKRDTLGVFVASVAPDGPAEKAGIVEGDRIARVNGTDLRVQAPEAGEGDMSHAMVSRFTREIGKLKAGDVATLTVVNAGRSREVKVTSVKSSDIHNADGFFFGDGAFIMPKMNFESFPQLKTIPPGTFRSFKIPPDGDNDRFQYYDGEKIKAEVKDKIEKAMEKARVEIDKARLESGKKAMVIRDQIKTKPTVKVIRITT